MATGDTLVNASGSFSSTGGYNTIVGSASGSNYTHTEDSNILIGAGIPGTANENNVFRVGLSTGTGDKQINKTSICGINGISVVGAAVLVSTSDQLGVLISTRSVKENINDMDDYSSDILNLRPVTFNYITDENKTLQSGLIAEEVNEVMPSLVVVDREGLPQTVKYHDLPALLLNELQKAVKIIDDLTRRIIALETK